MLSPVPSDISYEIARPKGSRYRVIVFSCRRPALSHAVYRPLKLGCRKCSKLLCTQVNLSWV